MTFYLCGYLHFSWIQYILERFPICGNIVKEAEKRGNIFVETNSNGGRLALFDLRRMEKREIVKYSIDAQSKFSAQNKKNKKSFFFLFYNTNNQGNIETPHPLGALESKNWTDNERVIVDHRHI